MGDVLETTSERLSMSNFRYESHTETESQPCVLVLPIQSVSYINWNLIKAQGILPQWVLQKVIQPQQSVHIWLCQQYLIYLGIEKKTLNIDEHWEDWFTTNYLTSHLTRKINTDGRIFFRVWSACLFINWSPVPDVCQMGGRGGGGRCKESVTDLSG